jgi:hypothetical protein
LAGPPKAGYARPGQLKKKKQEIIFFPHALVATAAGADDFDRFCSQIKVGKAKKKKKKNSKKK